MAAYFEATPIRIICAIQRTKAFFRKFFFSDLNSGLQAIELTSKSIESGHRKLHVNQHQILTKSIDSYTSISIREEGHWGATVMISLYE